MPTYDDFLPRNAKFTTSRFWYNCDLWLLIFLVFVLDLVIHWPVLFNCESVALRQWIKSISFSVWERYFARNFKGALWNSTQNVLPIHWKIWFSYNAEILRARRFKRSYAHTCCWYTSQGTVFISNQDFWIQNYVWNLHRWNLSHISQEQWVTCI